MSDTYVLPMRKVFRPNLDQDLWRLIKQAPDHLDQEVNTSERARNQVKQNEDSA
jgi:hypothetical protein